MNNINTPPIVEAAVEQPVSGKVTFGFGALGAPTPLYVRKIVRGLTWLTAIISMLSLSVDLKDFGVSDVLETLIVKYTAAFTGLVSALSRFLGVTPVNLSDRNQ